MSLEQQNVTSWTKKGDCPHCQMLMLCVRPLPKLPKQQYLTIWERGSIINFLSPEVTFSCFNNIQQCHNYKDCIAVVPCRKYPVIWKKKKKYCTLLFIRFYKTTYMRQLGTKHITWGWSECQIIWHNQHKYSMHTLTHSVSLSIFWDYGAGGVGVILGLSRY